MCLAARLPREVRRLIGVVHAWEEDVDGHVFVAKHPPKAVVRDSV